MFIVQTINCMEYNSELVVLNSIIKLGHNQAFEWNEHTPGTLHSKTQWFALIEKKLFGPQRREKTRRQERKANRTITIVGKNSKKVES